MSPTASFPFRPDYAIPPGETLRDRIAELAMSQTDLAARSGLSTKHINQIIQGLAPLTQETALILERVTGTPAGFWNRLEASFREAELRAQQRELTAEDDQWLSTMPVKALQAAGHLPTRADRSTLFHSLLAFFGVADRAAWDRIWMRPVASFKRAQAFRSDPSAIAAWLRLGELAVRDIITADFDPRQFRTALQQIRQLTRRADFSDELVSICAAAGVAVVYVREIDKSRISGATWWASPLRAVIQLSDRHKSDDQFWFAFFHEAAHLLLHSKKQTFIDDGSENDELEQEAHKFAASLLIPPAEAKRLQMLRTPEDVEKFAAEIGIASGIVVGRLHHDGLWEWSKGNKLRRRLQIVND